MGTINNYGNVLLPAGSSTIDVQSLLNTAITAASQPLTVLQQQQTTLQTQSTTLQGFENDVNTLATAVNGLSGTGGGVGSLDATSSNNSIMTATASSAATAQSHSITVNSLATTSTYYTDPVASSSTALATGSFTISVGGGTPTTVTVDDTDNTLDGLAAAINNQNLGVAASVVDDADGARLALVSGTTGAAGNIAITGNTTGLNFNQASAGANASLTVDGIPITSTSNTVSGVIPGVTLNLTNAAPGTAVSLSVTPDSNDAVTAVNQFVTAWNAVINDLNTEFAAPASGATAQPLEADGTLRQVQQQLLQAINFSVPGNNGIVNLGSIGLNMNDDGTITVDSSTLSSAVANNFSSVQALLQGTSGFAAGMTSTLNNFTDPTQGLLTLDLQGMTQSNQDLTTQISSMQATLQSQEQNLTTQYDQMQVALQELPLIQSQITQQLGALKSS